MTVAIWMISTVTGKRVAVVIKIEGSGCGDGEGRGRRGEESTTKAGEADWPSIAARLAEWQRLQQRHALSLGLSPELPFCLRRGGEKMDPNQ